jgi:hypothetical protein
MFKVTLQNLLDNRQWIGTFESEELANSWLAQQKLKPERLDIRVVPIIDSYRQEDVLEIIETEIDGQMLQTHVRLAAQASYSVEDISAQVNQQLINQESLTFLNNTDYKVLRHIRQKALNIQTSLTEQEYLDLEAERNQAANNIIR